LTPQEKVERNATIYKMFLRDRMTLAAIGRRFDLTRERVRQIVNKQRALHKKNV
tara:strand:- start:7595 stop:7756 length:162 start_codon:yes stop_codon:yes gene_type:complete